MAQTTFSIRMDENLKKNFDALCADFGMNVTTAITVFVKAVVREREIPFKIASVPNEVTIKAIEDVDAGVNLNGPFYSFEALMEDLYA